MEIKFRRKGEVVTVCFPKGSIPDAISPQDGFEGIDLTAYPVIYAKFGRYGDRKAKELHDRAPQAFIVYEFDWQNGFGEGVILPEQFNSNRVRFYKSAEQEGAEVEKKRKEDAETLREEVMTAIPGVCVRAYSDDENRKYREAKEQLNIFRGEDYWRIFFLFGLPDRAESAERNTIRFFWNGVGDRRMDPSRLFYGASGMSEPKLPGEKRLSWEEATRPWEARHVPCSVSPVPEHWAPGSGYSLLVSGKFCFFRFPKVTFSLEVLSDRGSNISCSEKVWRLIPESDRKEIAERIIRAIPFPEDVAEEVFFESEPVRKLLEAERERASFDVPGEIGTETVSSREWIDYPESDDGYRSAGSYETQVTYRVLSWGLSGEEKGKLLFPWDASEETMLQGTREILAQACEYARKAVRDLAWNNPYYGYLKFLSDSDREEWEGAYGHVCERIIARILREGQEAYEAEVSRRRGIVAAWESANIAHEKAVRAFEEARDAFRRVRTDLYEWDEALKEFPFRSHWQSPEDKEGYSAELAEWAEAIMEDIRTRAADRGFRLVNGKLDKLPPKDPKEREKIDRIRRQAGIKPLSPPEGEGEKPKLASMDSLAALMQKFGGK